MVERGSTSIPKIETPETATLVRPDLDKVVNKADSALQQAKAALHPYSAAAEGTPRRELFERVVAGEPVDQAAGDLRARSGLLVPAEDRDRLKDFQLRIMRTSPRVEINASVVNQVRNPALDKNPNVYSTADRGGTLKLTPGQLQAVQAYKATLNQDISKSAHALAAMEEKKGSPEFDPQAYEVALRKHEDLVHAAAPTPAILAIARGREIAQLHLANQEAGLDRFSTGMSAHYENLARGGASHGALEAAIGVPKPAVAGRYAGMEYAADLSPDRDQVIQRAIQAEPAASNVGILAAQLKSPLESMNLDHQALKSIQQTQQAELAQHQHALDAIIDVPPAAGPTLSERYGMVPMDPANPPFKGDGPQAPVVPETSGPTSDGPGEGGEGGNGGPGGPGNGPNRFKDIESQVHKFRPTILSPETAGLDALTKQIQEVEREAQARINRERMLMAVSVVGSIVTTAAGVATEVGFAAVNPNADPARALNHLANGFSTSTREVGQHLRQRVHELNKADQDIKAVVDQYRAGQRQYAEEWAEKMTNQLDHLDQIVPNPMDLDRAEQIVGKRVAGMPDFQTEYKSRLNGMAYDLHLAAAHELAMSPNERLSSTGAALVQELESQKDVLQKLSYSELNARVPDFGKSSNDMDSYKSVLKSMERQTYHAFLQDCTVKMVSNHIQDETLAKALGEENKALANRLLYRAVEGQAPHAISAEELKNAFVQKQGIERSVEASWRDLVARAPHHAEALVQGGMDAYHQMDNYFGRSLRDEDGHAITEANSPDRKAARNLRDFFSAEASGTRGRGVEEQGIPKGWGDSSVAGSRVGLAHSPGGGNQALLVGYHRDSDKIQEVAIHLFAKEGIQTPNESMAMMEKAGLKPRNFDEFKTSAPGPHAHVVIDGAEIQKELERLSKQSKIPLVNKAMEKLGDAGIVPSLDKVIQDKYNKQVQKAFTDMAESKLQADALVYAGIKVQDRPIRLAEAIHDVSGVRAAVDEYVSANRASYLERAKALADRESMQPATARIISAQLQEAHTAKGQNQMVEAGRGYFNYPPYRAALDVSPRKALETTDFRRLMSGVDNTFNSLPNQLKVARQTTNLAHDDRMLYKLNDPRSSSLAALLDSPVRQAHLADKGQNYTAIQAFLAKRGKGSSPRP